MRLNTRTQEKLGAVAIKIMCKMKGWRKEDLKADLEDHPEAHMGEKNWLILELDKIRKGNRCARKKK